MRTIVLLSQNMDTVPRDKRKLALNDRVIFGVSIAIDLEEDDFYNKIFALFQENCDKIGHLRKPAYVFL